MKEGIDLALPASLVMSCAHRALESCGICPDAPMPQWQMAKSFSMARQTECGDQRKEFFGETMLQKPSDCGIRGKTDFGIHANSRL